MHGVNLDLLRASVCHHPDGRPKDPHAHHRAEHLAEQREARRVGRRIVLARLLTRLRAESVKQAPTVEAKASCP